MADTDKQNFRYPRERWVAAGQKAAGMREQGFSIDMTKLLSAEVDRFLAETAEETAERLGLVAAGEPVPMWRNPFPRTEAAQ